MKHTIYQITNTVNGRIYIGKHTTDDPNDSYMGSGKLLKRAVRKYGIESFKKDVLFVFENEDEMNQKEQELVTEEFCRRKDTYNICPGGNGGFGYINSHGLSVNNISTENARALSERGRKKKQELLKDPKFKQKYYQAISEASKRRVEKYGPSFKGKTHTTEARLRMSNAKRGKYRGEENSQHGLKWMYHVGLKQNKKVLPENVSSELANGWILGRKYF